MSDQKKPMLALLQWIGGEYDKSYTAGVPVDWILDFDPETFDPTDDDISYVIEWRENNKNKKPKKGWKCYDARVIKTSRSLKSLEKQVAILEGLISPLRPTRTLETIQNNLKNPLKRTLEEDFDVNDQEEQPGTSGIKIKKKKGNSSNQQDIFIPELASDSEGDRNEVVPEQPEIEEEIGGDISHEQNHRDNLMIKRTLNDLVNEIRNLKETQTQMIRGQINQNPPQDANDRVEIGHAGSNVFVQRHQWDTANSRDTFQSMGLALVRALFDEETLLRSNLKGGLSKINKDAPRRPGLDIIIMAAIKETVKRKFPREFKQSLFGMAINNLMTDLRGKNKVADVIENEEFQQ